MKSLVIRVFKWIVRRILLITDRDFLVKLSNMLSKLNLWIQARLRQLDADNIRSVNSVNGVLRKFILNQDAPWLALEVRDNQIPGMISEEEKKYYTWLGQFYAGGALL